MNLNYLNFNVLRLIYFMWKDISAIIGWPSREDSCESLQELPLHTNECKEMYLNSRDATASDFQLGF